MHEKHRESMLFVLCCFGVCTVKCKTLGHMLFVSEYLNTQLLLSYFSKSATSMKTAAFWNMSQVPVKRP
jgi:hypothetical protein